MPLRRVAPRAAERTAGLDLREPRLRVDRDDATQILRALDHDCDVHALCAPRGAGTAREERRGVLAANRHGRFDILDRARQHMRLS